MLIITAKFQEWIVTDLCGKVVALCNSEQAAVEIASGQRDVLPSERPEAHVIRVATQPMAA